MIFKSLPAAYVMVSNHIHWIKARFLPVQKLARFHNYKVEHSLASTGISFAFVEFIIVKNRKQFAIIAVAGNMDMDGKVEIDEMMRQLQGHVSEYTWQLNNGDSVCCFLKSEKLGELL